MLVVGQKKGPDRERIGEEMLDPRHRKRSKMSSLSLSPQRQNQQKQHQKQERDACLELLGQKEAQEVEGALGSS